MQEFSLGIYRSHPIKASLRNLLLGLDAVSGRGDVTIEKLLKALERAEEYLIIGNIKKRINICYLFIYRTLKILSKKEKAKIEEILKDLRLKGYLIDSSELTKIKGIFIRARKGKIITEDEAKFCLKFVKHIKSFFKNRRRRKWKQYRSIEKDIEADIDINILLNQELKKLKK